MDKGKMAMSVEDLARENCASLLRVREERRAAARAAARAAKALASAASRMSLAKPVYNCKICNLTFKASQALGGHMAHHARIAQEGNGQGADAKIHECKVCHARFSSALALVGHQRKHVKESRKQRRDGHKAQTATHHDKPVLLSDPNHKPVLPFDLNLPPPVD